MLDGILGRGFSAKCKSLIKLTKSRIDVIRRKKNATQKFLKKDVADLLANGLDINAYGRAEGLLVEVILSSCYDFVDRCCDLVLKHLSAMQKQRECPEECRAAVASLMFAAARFSDLPELRDLRQMFYERYGSSLDLFRNEEFVENLASKPATLENRVRLMKEIALEFSIKWDSKAFEQRMSKPSMSPQEPPKAHGPQNGKDGSVSKADEVGFLSRPSRNGYNFHNKLEENIMKKDTHDKAHGLRNGKDGSVSKTDEVGFQSRPSKNEYSSLDGFEENIMKKCTHNYLLQGRREFGTDGQMAWNLKEDAAPTTVQSGSSSQRERLRSMATAGSKVHYGRERNIPIIENQDILPNDKPDMASAHTKSNGKEKFADDNFGGQHVCASSASKDDDLVHKPKPYYNNAIPPPYVKRNVKAKSRKHEAHLGPSDFDGSGVPIDSSTRDGANVVHMPEVVQRGFDHSDHERHIGRPERVNVHDHEKDHNYPEDATGNPIPKPRSSRRRHSRSRSGQTDAGNFEEAGVLPRKSRSKRREEDSKRGLQLLFDDEHRRTDEEERIIDKLLIHYSKKPSAYEPGKPRKRSSRSRHAHHEVDDVGESPRNGSRDASDKESQITPHPARSVSLPHEYSGAPSVATKVFTRAASFQPERSDGARHVHPKLPDYDDLAARFAALRGR